jgi:hypothetical protein
MRHTREFSINRLRTALRPLRLHEDSGYRYFPVTEKAEPSGDTAEGGALTTPLAFPAPRVYE